MTRWLLIAKWAAIALIVALIALFSITDPTISDGGINCSSTPPAGADC